MFYRPGNASSFVNSLFEHMTPVLDDVPAEMLSFFYSKGLAAMISLNYCYKAICRSLHAYAWQEEFTKL